MTDELTCAIALLHDVVEEVRLMTHTDDTDYFDYVRNIRDTVAEPVKRAVRILNGEE